MSCSHLRDQVAAPRRERETEHQKWSRLRRPSHSAYPMLVRRPLGRHLAVYVTAYMVALAGLLSALAPAHALAQAATFDPLGVICTSEGETTHPDAPQRHGSPESCAFLCVLAYGAASAPFASGVPAWSKDAPLPLATASPARWASPVLHAAGATTPGPLGARAPPA